MLIISVKNKEKASLNLPFDVAEEKEDSCFYQNRTLLSFVEVHFFQSDFLASP
jgi:hypothetical protein